MRFGIVILPEFPWSEARERWVRAERYGFEHAWTYDHLGWRNLVDGPWFDAVPTLAAAAGVTSKIRLGTHVASANFRHPVHFAREVTALDDIMNGRLLLGLGAGGLGFDAAVLGQPELLPGQRVDRFGEFVELLDLVLRHDQTTWKGKYYDAIDARGTPGCQQKPRVPFIVAANGRRSIRLAAQFGQGWITTGTVTEDLEAWWQAVADRVRWFDEAASENNRIASKIDKYLSLDSAPVYSLSNLECFIDAVGRAEELGFTDVISHWPRPRGWFAGEEAVLDQVAASVVWQDS